MVDYSSRDQNPLAPPHITVNCLENLFSSARYSQDSTIRLEEPFTLQITESYPDAISTRWNGCLEDVHLLVAHDCKHTTMACVAYGDHRFQWLTPGSYIVVHALKIIQHLQGKMYLVLENFTVPWTSGTAAPKYPVDVAGLKPMEGRRREKEAEEGAAQCDPKGGKRQHPAGVAAGVCTVPAGFTFKDGVVKPGPDIRIETKKAEVAPQNERKQQQQQPQRPHQHHKHHHHRKEHGHKKQHGANGNAGRQAPVRKQQHEGGKQEAAHYGVPRNEGLAAHHYKGYQNGPCVGQMPNGNYQPPRPPPPYRQQGVPHYQVPVGPNPRCTQQEQVVVEKIYVSRTQSTGTTVYEYPRYILTQGPQVYVGQEAAAYPASHQHKHQYHPSRPPRPQRHNQYPCAQNHGNIPSCCTCHAGPCSSTVPTWPHESGWGRGHVPGPMHSEMHSSHTRNCQQEIIGPPHLHPHQVNHTQLNVPPPGMLVPNFGMSSVQKRSYVHQGSGPGMGGLHNMGNESAQTQKMRDWHDPTKGNWAPVSAGTNCPGMPGMHQIAPMALQPVINHPQQCFPEAPSQVPRKPATNHNYRSVPNNPQVQQSSDTLERRRHIQWNVRNTKYASSIPAARFGTISRPDPPRTVEADPAVDYRQTDQVHSHCSHPQGSRANPEQVMFGTLCHQDVPGTGDCKHLPHSGSHPQEVGGNTSPGAPESTRRKWSDVVRDL